MKQLHFLFVMIDAGGNVPPMFGLMKQLLARDHCVHVLGEPCLEQPVQAIQGQFIAFTDYFLKQHRAEDFLQDHDATLLNNPVFERVMLGPAATVIEQTISVARSRSIDVLMVDFLLFPALSAAEVLDIPKMLIVHMPEFMPGPNRPPGLLGMKPGTGAVTKIRDRILAKLLVAKFNQFKQALNKTRAKLHLPPLTNTLDLIDSADLRIIQTLRSFDIPIEPAPKNVRYSGPVLDDPDWVQAEQIAYPWGDNPQRPLVVISFSSTFQNQKQDIQNSIDALAGLAVNGLVTLGLAMENEQFTVPQNVHLVNSVKHSEVFPDADLVITHAGHGTVLRALACGVPLLCIPIGRDQADNSVKVEMQGCGIKLSRHANPDKFETPATKY